MKSRTQIQARCATRAPAASHTPTVTTTRYEKAKDALAACWARRPKAFTPERETFEKHELKEARAEVRAAWIEAARMHGISPDRT